MILNPQFAKAVASTHLSSAQDRRTIQGISAEILGASKRSIFAMQRGDASAASAGLKEAVVLIKKGKLMITKRKRLAEEGIWHSCLEEYAEAALYHAVMTGRGIGFLPEIPKEETEIYLGALSDLSGELTRSCVLAATKRNMKEVERATSGVNEIVGFLIGLDLTGNLRQKYDQAKQNLRKVEEIALDLSMRVQK